MINVKDWGWFNMSILDALKIEFDAMIGKKFDRYRLNETFEKLAKVHNLKLYLCRQVNILEQGDRVLQVFLDSPNEITGIDYTDLDTFERCESQNKNTGTEEKAVSLKNYAYAFKELF